MMSNTEFHKGILRKIDLDSNVSFDAIIDYIKNTGETPEYYDIEDKYLECKGFHYNKKTNTLYKFIEHIENDDDDYFVDFRENDEKDIEFIAIFYNGGTFLGEIINENIEKLTKEVAHD